MVTVPQLPPTGKGTPLMLTTHPCPAAAPPSSGGPCLCISPQCPSTGASRASGLSASTRLPGQLAGRGGGACLSQHPPSACSPAWGRSQYSLGLPSAEGQVCLPQQWLGIGVPRHTSRSSCWTPIGRSGKERFYDHTRRADCRSPARLALREKCYPQFIKSGRLSMDEGLAGLCSYLQEHRERLISILRI